MNFFKKFLIVFFWQQYGVMCLNQETTNDTNFTTPEYILPCYKSDPDINNCLLKTFNHLRPYLVNGLTDLNVPSIDPFKIDKIVIENGQGPLKVKAQFFNVTANGAQNFTVNRIEANVKDYVIEIGFQFPRMDIRGKYDVNGNVLLFPVRSKGDFWAIFLDVDAAAKINGVEFVREGIRYMRIDKMLVDFRLKKSRFRIRDVINNGNVIGEAMNNFLNTNSEEIIKEMKPAARASIARHFKTFLNSAFSQLPLKIWLPDA